MNRYDNRSHLEKSIDQYVYVLQVACGEKNPVRRKAFETDVAYALEGAEPFKRRFEAVFAYDLAALDENCDAAVRKVNEALDVIHRIGAGKGLPEAVEHPRTILAECAMTLVDTLRSLDAFDAEAIEILLHDLFETFDAERVAAVLDRRLKIFMHRYINRKIPESVLDTVIMDEKRLHEYIGTL